MKLVTLSAIAFAISTALATPVLAQTAADTPGTTESGPGPLENPGLYRHDEVAIRNAYAYAPSTRIARAGRPFGPRPWQSGADWR